MYPATTRSLLRLGRVPATTCSCQLPSGFARAASSSTAAKPSNTVTTADSAIPSATNYTLPKGLVLRGIVTSAGKMAQTSTVTVERRVTDHKTLKVRTRLWNLLLDAHRNPRLTLTAVRSRSPSCPAGCTLQQQFLTHRKYLVHDPDNTCVVGDSVAIRNCKPRSKRKRFELIEVLKGARERVVMDDVADVAEVEGTVAQA